MLSPQDAADLELGRLVRAIWDRRHNVECRNRLDDGAEVIIGFDHTMSWGETLDDAVSIAANKSGIMTRTKTAPPRDAMPTMTEVRLADEDRAMLADRYRLIRGKP